MAGLSAAVTATVAAIAWSAAAFAGPQFISLGTGPVSGLYYPTGQAICELVNAAGRKGPLRCSVGATPGSVYNAEAVASGEEDFALVQSDVHYFAVKGEGRWQERPLGKIRSVMSLYPELLAVIARPDAGMTSAAELRGKRLNIGAPGSGTRATWEVLKGALGITEADLAEAAELKPEAAAERLCANKLDASLMIVGHPSSLIEAQLKSCGLTIVPVAGKGVDELVASKPYYVAGAILASHYGLASDTPTFGGQTTLIASSDVSEAAVYELTMAIIRNLDKLKRQPVLTGLDPAWMATQSLTAPLHPGAERAFRELGLLK